MQLVNTKRPGIPWALGTHTTLCRKPFMIIYQAKHKWFHRLNIMLLLDWRELIGKVLCGILYVCRVEECWSRYLNGDVFLTPRVVHMYCAGLKVELCRVRRLSREQLNIMSLLWFVTHLNLHSLHSWPLELNLLVAAGRLTPPPGFQGWIKI